MSDKIYDTNPETCDICGEKLFDFPSIETHKAEWINGEIRTVVIEVSHSICDSIHY